MNNALKKSFFASFCESFIPLWEWAHHWHMVLKYFGALGPSGCTGVMAKLKDGTIVDLRERPFIDTRDWVVCKRCSKKTFIVNSRDLRDFENMGFDYNGKYK